MLGCLRCKLLAEAALLFRNEWAIKIEEESNLVELTVQKGLNDSRAPFYTALKWPSNITSPEIFETIHIQITTEEDWWILDSAFAIARMVPSDSTAPESIDFIRSQLVSCDKTHDHCKKMQEDVTTWPKRLLKIDQSRDDANVILVENSEKSRKYIALSHCWGKKGTSTEPLKTISKDLEKHMSTGIPELSRTKTFRDAMDVSRKLGIQYIWIDSLCIIQDDDNDWEEEAQKMGDIYGNAYLVISATLAHNGDEGLYQERSPYRIEVTTQAGQTVKAQVFEKSHHDIWKKGAQYWEAPKLPLFGRAWAFQERLLARRVIHYTPTELVWECWSYIGCECGDLQNPRTSWAQFAGGGKNLKTKYGEVARWGNDNERINFWHDICAQYCARQLTYATDRLPALASIAKRMHIQELHGNYLAGIWECTLPKGLFWWSDTSHLTPYSPGNTTHWRDKTHNIPTWSWLSIEGRGCTWGKIHTSLIDILDVSYTVGSTDVYGPCERGIITVESHCVPIKLVDARRPDGPSNQKVLLPGTEEMVDFTADENPFK